MGLCRLQLPERPTHVGMAGLAQALGLFVFLLLALSGIFLFFTIDPGHKSRGIVHAVKEFHEVGLFLILLFLSMHMGAVTMHALRGHHLWRKMIFLKEPQIAEKKERQKCLQT
jgi:cbb3-type cytochrome oxidase subunit 3